MTGEMSRREEAPVLPKRILVGYDGSRDADHAFDDALELAAVCGAAVWVVSAATVPEPPTEVETRAALDEATRHFEEIDEGLQRRAAERGVRLSTRVLVGHPAEQILKLAADIDADLIVVGHRGRSGIRQWIFGSTSQRVVSYARCSVLVVRPR
jgi:nucleotide-binding universal stress UspA family protein